MRMGRIVAGCALLLLAAGSGCTQRYTVPKDKQPCATACTQSQSACVNRCAVPKQDVQVLEDVRGSLCEKRCKEEYEGCVKACL